MTLNELIELRGVEKPNYIMQGLPKDNCWTSYYNGWRDAYKDLKEIFEQHNPELLNLIIIPLESNKNI